MKKSLVIALFLGISIVQVITPLSMIVKREYVLKNGEQFKFKTAPVDPYDAFRGRYVALRIQGDELSASKGLELSSGQTVYAVINTDDQGFAKIVRLSIDTPRGEAYIQAKVKYIFGDKITLDLPIDRYYMEEKAAPAADRIYRQFAQRDKQDAYIIVRIKDGFAVVESLYVGGQKIEDAVKQGGVGAS
ncbi:MAG: GDYXXLXY domain-containing protein [Candidatus Omnitrophica bacterium]|nr:GDYXXLXY domain-containing protein [Candidatus Omnitrophota bacterium]